MQLLLLNVKALFFYIFNIFSGLHNETCFLSQNPWEISNFVLVLLFCVRLFNIFQLIVLVETWFGFSAFIGTLGV